MRNFVENSRIIHALDVEDEERALRIASDICDYVDSIKISYPLVLRHGLKVVKELKNATNLPILACFKVADIPLISARIVDVTIDSGADGITVHGITGRDSVKQCIDTANKRGVSTFVVTEMSHPGAEQFYQKLGDKIAKMARELGATGIVAPATRPNRVKRYREIIGKDMLIISPGIGPQGGQIGDAIKEGANFEVIGRLIYTSKDPARTAREISQKLRKRLEVPVAAM
jgi:orotidine-5'-phosphate decarboxylase